MKPIKKDRFKRLGLTINHKGSHVKVKNRYDKYHPLNNPIK